MTRTGRLIPVPGVDLSFGVVHHDGVVVHPVVGVVALPAVVGVEALSVADPLVAAVVVPVGDFNITKPSNKSCKIGNIILQIITPE